MSYSTAVLIVFAIQAILFTIGLGNIAKMMTGIKILRDVEMLRTKEEFDELRKHGVISIATLSSVMFIAVLMFLFIQAGYL